MKKLDAKKDVLCMSCSACELSCSQAYYKRMDPSVSSVQIAANKQGIVRPKVCIQCGKCAKNCPEEAITKNAKGVYMVDKKKCTGCGKCAEVCPFGVCIKAPDRETATKCISCGICVKACPMDLLYIKED